LAALTDEQCREALRIYLSNGGNMSAASRKAGMPEPTFRARVVRARQRNLRVEVDAQSHGDPPTARSEVDVLRDEVIELRAQLRSVRQNTLDDEYVKRKLIGLSESIDNTRPIPWIPRKAGNSTLPGVPVALWSDWHWGEVVDPRQINGVNEYNLAIAQARARKLVEKTIFLLRQHVVNPKFPGIVVNLGGDMLSGDIHEELSETNDVPMMPALLDLYGVLRWAIATLADEFGNVYLPCVTGNHGRNTRKPRAKQRNFTNFDWLLYQFLQKLFAGDDRVQFFIPDGPDAFYRVYNHRYLLTHGDQFRGGDGQIGALGPMTRGNKRKQARNAAIGLEYDTMLMGHWHRWVPMVDQITNGSLKGYDEYANAMNFAFQIPIQGLWLTHPTKGITITMPVKLEDEPGAQEAAPWVSWKDAA